MEDSFIYLLIVASSCLLAAFDAVTSVKQGNIVHLENGRELQAGVSLIFYAAFPIFFVAVAYVGNLFTAKFGFYLSIGIIVICAIYMAIDNNKLNRRLNVLRKKQGS